MKCEEFLLNPPRNKLLLLRTQQRRVGGEGKPETDSRFPSLHDKIPSTRLISISLSGAQIIFPLFFPLSVCVYGLERNVIRPSFGFWGKGWVLSPMEI